MKDKIQELKQSLRLIISTALYKRDDSIKINYDIKKLHPDSSGYIQANTDAMEEIEAEILKIIDKE